MSSLIAPSKPSSLIRKNEKSHGFLTRKVEDKKVPLIEAPMTSRDAVPRVACLWAPRGRGKSLDAVHMSKRLKLHSEARGIRYYVYSNIWISFADISDEYIYDTFQKLQLKGPGVFVFDEVTQILNAKRATGRNVLPIEFAFKMIRKLGLDIIMTDQHPYQLTRNIQAQIDFFIKPKLDKRDMLVNGRMRHFCAVKELWFDWKGDVTQRYREQKTMPRDEDADKVLYWTGLEKSYFEYKTNEYVFSPHTEHGKRALEHQQAVRNFYDGLYEGEEHFEWAPLYVKMKGILVAGGEDPLDITPETVQETLATAGIIEDDTGFYHRPWALCGKC